MELRYEEWGNAGVSTGIVMEPACLQKKLGGDFFGSLGGFLKILMYSLMAIENNNNQRIVLKCM